LIALPDVNVLLALVWSNHPHHEAAHDWFGREATDGWATSILTQSAFMRLCLNPTIVGGTIDSRAAYQLLVDLTAHPNHRFVGATPSLCENDFNELIPSITGYRQVTDATLLYVARAAGAKLVTFDKSIASLCPWSEELLVLFP
jgi:toxin-antitoxin system PIN domain toxin